MQIKERGEDGLLKEPVEMEVRILAEKIKSGELKLKDIPRKLSAEVSALLKA